MKRDRGKTHPSEEDLALWRKVVEKATPLGPERIQYTDKYELKPAALNPVSEEKMFHPFKLGEKARMPRTENRLVPNLNEAFSNVSPNMDKRNFDRLKKGRMPIEGRLDLHGMTQKLAHRELISFILDSSIAGKRMLLIITGKGKISHDDGVMPVRQGVLKHAVPQWLRMPPLGPLVLQVTQASARHGGTGAYYVYLRRRR